MKVLINALQAGNRSGTGRYTSELVSNLLPFSNDVDLIIAWPKGLPIPKSEDSGNASFININLDGHFKRIAYDQFSIRNESKRSGVDVVHFPANIGRMKSLDNMVVTVHDLSYLRHPEWFRFDRAAYYRFAAKRSVSNACRVIADSQATAEDLIEILGTDENKIDVIPLGVDESFKPASDDECKAVKTKYELPDQFLLFMATVEPRKNVVRLIEAWSSIADKCPFDLIIAGRLGWKVKPILKAALRSAHSKRIHFPGFIADEDQAPLLSAAHAFVWPALWEGFGLPPLESMACGTPVLTSNTSCLPETVGNAALQVDPYNIEAIAQGMLEVATETDLRERLISQGYERASQYTWKRTAELTIETYRVVMAMDL